MSSEITVTTDSEITIRGPLVSSVTVSILVGSAELAA